MTYVSLVALCVAVASCVPWFRHRHILEHPLLDLEPGEFNKLHPYLDEDATTDPCEEFWTLSQGIAGLRIRLRRMVLIVRHLQHQVRAGHISPADARYVWAPAAKQVWFTVFALPEAAICSVWRGLPHAMGLFALRCHHEVSLRAFTVCSTDGASIDIERLL